MVTGTYPGQAVSSK